MASYPMGPCKLTFTLDGGSPVVIDQTVEGQDCVFTAPYETTEVKVHQMPGAQAGNHFLPEAPTFTCSILADKTILSGLGSAYVDGAVSGTGFLAHGANIKFGALTIHPMSAGDSDATNDIIGKKVYCQITNVLEFSNEGITRADLVFKFSGNPTDTDADYLMPFTIGAYVEA